MRRDHPTGGAVTWAGCGPPDPDGRHGRDPPRHSRRRHIALVQGDAQSQGPSSVPRCAAPSGVIGSAARLAIPTCRSAAREVPTRPISLPSNYDRAEGGAERLGVGAGVDLADRLRVHDAGRVAGTDGVGSLGRGGGYLAVTGWQQMTDSYAPRRSPPQCSSSCRTRARG